MKTLILTLTFISSAALAATNDPTNKQVNSEGQSTAQAPAKETKFQDHRHFQVGYIYGYQNYYENDDHVQAIHMHGIGLSGYTKTSMENIIMGGEAEVASGAAPYQGKTVRGETVNGDIREMSYTVRAKAYLTNDQERISYRPYVGLGYRSDTTEIRTPGGYPRVSDQFFVPLGLDVRFLSGRTLFVTTAELDAVMSNKSTSYLSHVDSALPDVEQKSDSGIGFRLAGKAMIPAQELGNWIVEAYYQYWKFAESEGKMLAANLEYKRPPMSYQTVGLGLGVNF